MAEPLLAAFASSITSTPDSAELLRVGSPLHLASERSGAKRIDVFYAPFEHVEPGARIVIVGLTPGRHQAFVALDACRSALCSGMGEAQALRTAKNAASFSGPMRANLVRMLDAIGVAAALGLHTAAELWSTAAGMAHFTSLVRNPVFVDDRNWSGSPDPIGTRSLCHWSAAWTGHELRELAPEMIIPLGPSATRGVDHLASLGFVESKRVLRAMPHPSGANAERVACFLGTKHPDRASAKTDGHALVAARERLKSQIGELTHVRPDGTPPSGINRALTTADVRAGG